MASVLLILALAGQCLAMKPEQELAPFRGAAQHTHLASPSNNAHSHAGASVINLPPGPRDVRLDAEGLARSLPSGNPESSHPNDLAITIETDSNPNEEGQTPISFTQSEKPESSLAGQAAIKQMQVEEDNHSAKPHFEQITSCPDNASISQSKEAESQVGTSQTRNECVICSEEVNALIGPDLLCGHLFHEKCLSGWINADAALVNRFRCPVCMRDLVKKEPTSDTNRSFWDCLARLNQPVPVAPSSAAELQVADTNSALGTGVVVRHGDSVMRTEAEYLFLTFWKYRLIGNQRFDVTVGWVITFFTSFAVFYVILIHVAHYLLIWRSHLHH